MNAKKRQKIVFTVFVLAVIWGIYNQPWKHHELPQPEQQGPASAVSQSGTAQPVMASLQPAPRETDTIQWVSHWTIDPFHREEPEVVSKTTTIESAPEDEPVLQGTMIAGTDRVCVIGGRLLKKGDRTGAWRVDAISDDGVTLIRISDGRHLTLQTAETPELGRR
jgi:hypothetical protein